MASKVIIGLIAGCTLLGGYASMWTSYHYGYLDALRNCVSSLPHGECILDMSDAFVQSITGVNAIDDLINILLEFFSQGLRSNPDLEGIDLEALLAFVYLAAQFGGAWYLIALEGLRQGNKGTVLSWTGTFGVIFQAVTITIIAPVYLIIQLLQSPSDAPEETLLVLPSDLDLLPLSAILTYVIPTIGLCLPILNLLSDKAKFYVVAFWQPFPLYHTIVRGTSQILHRGKYLDTNKRSKVYIQRCRQVLKRSNCIMALLVVTVHMTVLTTIMISVTTQLVTQVSGHHILALTSLKRPPTMAIFHPPVTLTESREIVVSFLRWDVYCTCIAMVIWATYHRYRVQSSSYGLIIIIKALFYTGVGGPIFPALMFIWERDEIVLDRVGSSHKDHASAKGSEVQSDMIEAK